jgi:hypothetical protein
VPGEERRDRDGRDDEPAERDDAASVEACHAGFSRTTTAQESTT